MPIKIEIHVTLVYILTKILFNVLRWLWNIYEGAEPTVCFIIITKHFKTYLALTQRCLVLLTPRLHIVTYTHYVAFCCISIRSMSFLFSHRCDAFRWDERILLVAFFFRFFAKLSGKYFTDHTLQMYMLISPH